MINGEGWSKTWTFFEGSWHEGNVPIMGPRTHAAWLCSIVFDGARAFEGVTPDLELHCARVNVSAVKLYLKPMVSTETWVKLAQDRKSTRLNSSHQIISYAVFCLKKKKTPTFI